MKGKHKIVYFPGVNSSDPSDQVVPNQLSTNTQDGNAGPIQTDQDMSLLQQIAQQSEIALTQLYCKYNQFVMAFAMSQLACERDCREIVNDVFLTIWQHADRFEGRSTVRTWMLGITRHKMIDVIRKKRRQQNGYDDYQLQNLWESQTVDDPMEAQQDSAMIKDCINRLSPAHREAIHLAFYQDLSCSEIADVLGCPIGTVKTRLMHARNHLKCMLSEYEIVE